MESKITQLFLLCLLCIYSVRSAVIGIDFGSQYWKAVLVRPGKPFTIVENTSSQRKTENAMTFTNEERLFEKDAVSQSTSFSSSSMLQSLSLLGMEYSEESVNRLKEEWLFTNEFVQDNRGLVGYQVTIPDRQGTLQVDFYIEEVIAMIFQHCKKLAKQMAEGDSSIHDVTITVPSYFTQSQRTMLRDAAELSGFSVLTLLNENTAAALMYGIDNKIQSPRSVLFINMGASNLELSLVKFSNVEGSKDKQILSVHVVDEAAVEGLGGHAFDVQLTRIMAERFDGMQQREGEESIMKDDKVVRRLMREVQKFKEILSSNKQTPVKLVEVDGKHNLEFVLEREEFEQRIKDIVERATPAFKSILAKHPLDTIDEVEILGGGLRVPYVKDFFSAILDNKPLNTHMNPDEAMAFGSAFIAANFSSSYQVQKVYLYQSVPETVYLNITQKGCNKDETEECFTKHMKLYDEFTDVLGQKRTITIQNHIENMNYVLYTIDNDGNENPMIKGKVRGAETAKDSTINSRDTITKRKLTLVFKYDKNGILSLKKGEATLVETVEDKPKKKSNSTEEEAEEKPKTREKNHSFNLKITEHLIGPQPMTAAHKSKAKKRAGEAEKRDKMHEKHKVITNEYESLIYSSRDFIQDEDTLPYFKNEDEKEKLMLFLNEEEDWLYSDGTTASSDIIKNKLKVLEKKINPLKKRKTSREILPEEINALRKTLDENEKGFKKFIKKKDWLPQADLDEYTKTLTSERELLDSKEKDLMDTPLNTKAPFTVSSLRAEISQTITKLKYIKGIKKPKAAQKEVKSKGELIEAPEPEEEEEVSEGVRDEEEIADSRTQNMDPQMREQVDRLLKKEKLKQQVVSGDVDVADLSQEDLRLIGM